MPKHGWKWRTEQFLALPREKQGGILQYGWGKVSAKFARWVYEEMDDEDLSDYALGCIGWDDRCPWATQFLWKELHRRKREGNATWIIEAMHHGPHYSARQMIDLYYDPVAHPLVQADAIFALGNSLQHAHWEQQPAPEGILEATRHALNNAENVDARYFEIRVARYFGGFQHGLAEMGLTETVNTYGYDFSEELSDDAWPFP